MFLVERASITVVVSSKQRVYVVYGNSMPKIQRAGMLIYIYIYIYTAPQIPPVPSFHIPTSHHRNLTSYILATPGPRMARGYCGGCN